MEIAGEGARWLRFGPNAGRRCDMVELGHGHGY